MLESTDIVPRKTGRPRKSTEKKEYQLCAFVMPCGPPLAHPFILDISQGQSHSENMKEEISERSNSYILNRLLFFDLVQPKHLY